MSLEESMSSDGCDQMRRTPVPSEHGQETECDQSECGGEGEGPHNDAHICGVDYRPALPLLLFTSTVVGAVYTFEGILPLVTTSRCAQALLLALDMAAAYCFFYCSCCDPGQVKEGCLRSESTEQLRKDSCDEELDLEEGIPARAHKTWLYERPVRRYDHYCKWLANVIGLRNHRSFVVMCSCLFLIGTAGMLLDLTVIGSAIKTYYAASSGPEEANANDDVTGVAGLPPNAVFWVLHLIYNLGMAVKVGSIVHIHIGLIARNELAFEWTHEYNYVVANKRTGIEVPVDDLSEDEREERANSFRYDRNRNVFDKGTWANCIAFWCTDRSDATDGAF